MPYSLCYGNHAKCYGTNRVGLRRRGHSKETIEKIRHAFHLLLSSKLNTTQAVERIREEITDCPEVDHVVEFIESSARGVIK
jgi:UDP-N-acetylglucosamine acyltransferase